MGSYPDRALAYAFEAERVAPQAVESGIALAYAFESLEAGRDKTAARVKVQNLVASEKGGSDLDYLRWVTNSDQPAESYPDQIDPETLTSVRMLVDLGTYFVNEAEKKSSPDRERLLKRGISFCDRASLLAPENPIASFCQGYASATAGNMSEAHDHYAKALQSEAEFPRARNNLGYAYAVMGDYNGAKNLFEAAVVTLDAPLDSKALWLHNLGSDYLELNQIEKACDAWTRAAQLPGSNDTFRTFWGLSMCSYEKNDKKQSLENYRKAVELAHKENLDLTKLSTFQEGKAGPNELHIVTDLMKARH